MSNLQRPKQLKCTCCGRYFTGRQWFNQDTGAGLCSGCVPFCHRNMTDAEFERCYGVDGVHYNLKGEDER